MNMLQEDETVWLAHETLTADGDIKSNLSCGKCGFNGINDGANARVYTGWRFCPMCGRKIVQRTVVE